MSDTATVETTSFDMFTIDAWVEGDKVKGRCGGILGQAMQPFVDQFYNTLNGLKVIAHVDGKPVYNLFNPPQPTKAGMRFLQRKLRMMLVKHALPVTANLAITERCQCKCVHCSADPFKDAGKTPVTTEEVKTVVDSALDLGANLVIYVGGEPMMSKNLYELIEYIDKDKAVAMIFTNGQFLTADNVKKLKDAGLFSMNLSIDSVDPEEHNKWRAVPNLFQTALDGAHRAMDAGILVGISTYATGETLRNGKVERLLKFAQAEGFKEVTIFDVIPSGKFLKDTSLILTPQEKKELGELAKAYVKMSHPMGVSAQCLINSPEGVGCYGAASQFYMTAYGDINPCDFNPINFGNIREMSVKQIWTRMVKHEDFCKRHGGCRMQTPSYRKKYIDPIPEGATLPIPIEEYAGQPPIGE